MMNRKKKKKKALGTNEKKMMMIKVTTHPNKRLFSPFNQKQKSYFCNIKNLLKKPSPLKI